MDFTSGSNELVIASDNLTKSKVEPFSNLFEDIKEFDLKNFTVFDSFSKAYSVINNPKYQRIICSISGGSDSDVMLDLIYRCDKEHKVRYVWMDTGLEYKATKEHIAFLEKKYNISVERYRGVPIPLTTRKFGQPCISKNAAEYIYRLQLHDFKWEDKPFEELLEEYPNCKSALEWWCNKKISPRLNISWNKYLKEFMVANPPRFKISAKCCLYSKEKVAADIYTNENCHLGIVGLRKAEGGVRSVRFHNCISLKPEGGCDEYRPLFWFKNKDKADYEKTFEVKHSECYSKYCLPRTGCACCPFGLGFEQELEVARQYEPNLYTAANNIFGDSYEYTRKYRRFVELMNQERPNKKVR